ncbi:MAG TPA: hypothetical protein VJ032_00845, partial [Thermoanaerobaculia bacterium]|nr:hypothetical protein [Thermoanaerobaculia bacterium]
SISYDRTDANSERLADALREINARPRGDFRDLPYVASADDLRDADTARFVTDYGDFDCIGALPREVDYNEMRARSLVVDSAANSPFQVCSVDDFFVLKRALGHPGLIS